MRRLFATVAIAASLIAGAASAQTSVILRKPDNSAAVDPANAANQASANTKLDQIHTDAITTRSDTRTAAANITAADVATASVAGQSGVTLVTGAPTALSSITWPVNGQSSAALTVTGTFVETAQIEASFDNGLTYVPTSALLRGTSTLTALVTGDGVLSVDLTGATHIRLRATSYTSGTLQAALTVSPAPGMTKILNPVLPGPTASTTPRNITITTGGAAQLVMAANAARRSFYAFNPNASGTCWASFTTTTPAANGLGAFPFPSLGGFGMEVSPTTNALYVNCPTTGQFITAWESQ